MDETHPVKLLSLNFGIDNGCHWIHTWRDERRIEVDCVGTLKLNITEF